MGMNVVGKFGKGEEMCPVIGLIVAENTKELFNFLVDAFYFSISLGVEGSRQGLVNIELVSSFSHELGGKLRASV